MLLKNISLFCMAICCTMLLPKNVDAAKRASVLELRVGKEVHTGRLEAKNSGTAWLMNRDGKLEQVTLSKVTKFRKVSSRFKPQSARELRRSLAHELGNKYEMASRGSYLIAAPKGRAKQYAAIFDDMHRSFQHYFSTRGFRIPKPEFPLVAIVFRTQTEFVAYTKKDHFKAIQGLAGYYYPKSNRVALYESRSRTAFYPSQNHSVARNQNSNDDITLGNHFNWYGKARGRSSTNRTLRDTMVHEATHQIAYNVGLHSRMGETPRWMVEGLATMLEPEGARRNSRSGSAMKRINHQRYLRFMDFAKNRRKEKSLKSFIESETLYQTNVLDFYAQSWGLSFYLAETQPRKYSKYLKTIASRPPLSKYSKSERLADFEKVFGKKIDWMEVGFLRYMKRLK